MKLNLSVSPLPNEWEYSFQNERLHHSIFNLDWIEDPEIIFDVGAWDFGDSVRFKNRFPNAEVYSFELMQENYNRFSPLAESIGINTYNLGVSDNNEMSKFYKAAHSHGDNAQSSLLEPSDLYKERYGSIVSHQESENLVQCTTLSSFCINNSISHIDVLHIDVEGAEGKVLRGLGDLRPTLIFAEFLIDGGWKGQQSFKDILDHLYYIGYIIEKDMGSDKLFRFAGE
jgi:FkbM family methyltransferase